MRRRSLPAAVAGCAHAGRPGPSGVLPMNRGDTHAASSWCRSCRRPAGITIHIPSRAALLSRPGRIVARGQTAPPSPRERRRLPVRYTRDLPKRSRCPRQSRLQTPGRRPPTGKEYATILRPRLRLRHDGSASLSSISLPATKPTCRFQPRMTWGPVTSRPAAQRPCRRRPLSHAL